MWIGQSTQIRRFPATISSYVTKIDLLKMTAINPMINRRGINNFRFFLKFISSKFMAKFDFKSIRMDKSSIVSKKTNDEIKLSPKAKEAKNKISSTKVLPIVWALANFKTGGV